VPDLNALDFSKFDLPHRCSPVHGHWTIGAASYTC
jgi:hypothetical protein